MAGMFIDGMAGMKSTTCTVASATGSPVGCRTVTSNVLSPARGGSGWLVSAIASASVATGVPATGGGISKPGIAARSWLSESMKNAAPVATTSPFDSPDLISIRAPSRCPVSTRRG